LPILPDTAAAIPVLLDDARTAFLVKQGVLSREEIHSRAEIIAERYVKQIEIEARSLAELVRTAVVPAVEQQLARSGAARAGAGAGFTHLDARLTAFAELLDALLAGEAALQAAVDGRGASDVVVLAAETARGVVPAMATLRASAEVAEALVADDLWQIPRYREMLFIGV
jgi:glutamine synthetase